MRETNQTLTKYLTYAALILLILNFALMFFPFLEVYQPSYKQTTFEGITYSGWYTSSLAPWMLLFPILTTAIPYFCSIISAPISCARRRGKNNLVKIIRSNVTKPIHFFWLKIATAANIYFMGKAYIECLFEVLDLKVEGAYCNLTFLGCVHIFSSLAFIVLLFVLSQRTKKMFSTIYAVAKSTDSAIFLNNE